MRDFDSFVAARTLLERALALDPGYSHARALICRLTEAARSERWLSREEAARCLPLAEDVVTATRAMTRWPWPLPALRLRFLKSSSSGGCISCGRPMPSIQIPAMC
jgi:hypothetical protein